MFNKFVSWLHTSIVNSGQGMWIPNIKTCVFRWIPSVKTWKSWRWRNCLKEDCIRQNKPNRWNKNKMSSLEFPRGEKLQGSCSQKKVGCQFTILNVQNLNWMFKFRAKHRLDSKSKRFGRLNNKLKYVNIHSAFQNRNFRWGPRSQVCAR